MGSFYLSHRLMLLKIRDVVQAWTEHRGSWDVERII